MADKFKNIAKNGWHSDKGRAAAGGGGGQGESRLGSRVGGMLGRGGGQDSHVEQARNHQSAPLSTLKDPSTFAPPPKRLDYNRDPTASALARTTTTGAPAVTARQRLQEKQRAEEEADRPPPGPFRPDTTGLDTAHLPKPPAFRPSAAPPTTGAATKPKPNLPPRLPPRQNSNPNEYAPSPPPTYNEATKQGAASPGGVLNQGALNRLGQAGVSVPGLNVGRDALPPVPARQNTAPTNAPVSPPNSAGYGSQMGELQSRFSNMSSTQSSGVTPTTGTSWADKQAALRTAGSLRDDPSKVSATDLKGAASTANNFQQRHGAQVASGWKAANGLNTRYGLSGKVNSLASSNSSVAPSQPTPPQSPGIASNPGGLGKKAPPPPPPKKRELGGSSGEPPPIPISSKPRF